MKRTSMAILPILAFVFLTYGCTLKYKPKPVEIEAYKIPNLTANQPIAFVNVQRAGQVLDLRVSPYKVKVDLHGYTDTVIDLIVDAVKKKKVIISDTSDKAVKIAVIDVGVITRATVFKCDISYTVEAEEIQRYGGEASGESWNFQKAIDIAVTETAVQILNDPRFTDYLQQ